MSEMEPVAQQWAVFENGLHKTSWTPSGYGDEAGWAEVSKRYEFFSVEYRDLVTLSQSQSLLAERDKRIAELEELAKAFEAEANQMREVSIMNRHRAEAAEALLKEAGKVLEPFAERAAEYDDCPYDWVSAWPTFTVGDFRAARSLASKIGVGNE